MNDETRQISDVEEKVAEAIKEHRDPPPDFPRVNSYVCKTCGHVSHTVDVAEGTTTMILPCMARTESRIELVTGEKATVCGGEMLSSFYCVDFDSFDFDDIAFEWRYATLPEYRDYKKKGLALANHVADGGLVLHKRTNKEAAMLTHGGKFVRPNGTFLSDSEADALQTGLQVLKEVVRLDVDKVKRKRHAKLMQEQARKKKRRRKRGK